MKKVLVALTLAAFASTASAAIAGGKHDMTRFPLSGGGSATKGTCQYCHAPHLWITSNIPVSGGEAPLWNRNNNSTYQVYTTTTNQGGNPGARSLTCLSCHDGATNPGVVNNGESDTLNMASAGFYNMTTDLRDDHPVGVTLPGTGYVIPPALSPTQIGLINSRVECASCHEPHSNATAFLRMTGGAICSACHAK